MPKAEDIAAIYDFENVFDAAIKAAFDVQGFNTLVRADTSSFQEKRPRIEIVTKVGAGSPAGKDGALKILQNVILEDDIPALPVLALCAAYKGIAYCSIITNGTEDDKEEHAVYLFQGRWILGTLPGRVNYKRLTNHTMNSPVIPGETTTEFNKSEGLWISRFPAEFSFTIRDQSWNLLTQ